MAFSVLLALTRPLRSLRSSARAAETPLAERDAGDGHRSEDSLTGGSLAVDVPATQPLQQQQIYEQQTQLLAERDANIEALQLALEDTTRRQQAAERNIETLVAEVQSARDAAWEHNRQNAEWKAAHEHLKLSHEELKLSLDSLLGAATTQLLQQQTQCLAERDASIDALQQTLRASEAAVAEKSGQVARLQALMATPSFLRSGSTVFAPTESDPVVSPCRSRRDQILRSRSILTPAIDVVTSLSESDPASAVVSPCRSPSVLDYLKSQI